MRTQNLEVQTSISNPCWFKHVRKFIKYVSQIRQYSLFSLSEQSLDYLWFICIAFKITRLLIMFSILYYPCDPDVNFFSTKNFSVRCFRRARLHLITEPDQISDDVVCQRQESDTMFYCFKYWLSRDIRIGLKTSHKRSPCVEHYCFRRRERALSIC